MVTRVAARGSLPIAATSRAVAVDDLIAVNTEPSEALNRWAQTAPEDWAVLEAQVRASIRQGDNFVQVPFPRVAVVGDRMIVAAAIADYRREVAIVDPRLQQGISLSGKGISFVSLCQQVYRQTGVEIVADPTVADDKITVFCTNRPLREVMRQISRLFGFTWRREGTTGAYRYALTQELKAQLLEADLRNRDRDTALAALDADMQAYRPLLGLSPDEAFRQGVEELKRKKALLASGRTVSAVLEDRIRRLELISCGGWAGIQLYFRLTPEQREMLERQEELLFKPENMPTPASQQAVFALPANMREGILESMAGSYLFVDKAGNVTGSEGGRLLEYPDDGVAPSGTVSLREWDKHHPLYLKALLQIQEPELGRFDLKASSVYADPMSYASGSSTPAVAEGVSPSVRTPNNAVRHKVEFSPETRNVLRHAPGIRLGKLRSSVPPPVQRAVHLPARITYADALEAIHRSTGMDVMSDYFTRLYDPAIIALPERVPLSAGLDQLCDALGLRWKAETAHGKVDWLTFRDAGFFVDRPKEVPARLLEHWAEDRRKEGHLPIGDLREVAQLCDAQLDSVSVEEGAVYLYDLREWDLVTHGLPRNVWRFLQSLSPEQQDKVWSAEGLAASELTPEERSKAYNSQMLTRIYGQYTVTPLAQQTLSSWSSAVPMFDAGKIDVDFHMGDRTYRVGMGGQGY